MAETKTKAEREQEGRGQSLPVNHPQAGYVSPDLSFREGVGKLPEREQAWHDERDKARDEQTEKVGDSEDKLAKEIQKNEEEYNEKLAKAREAQLAIQVKQGVIPEPVERPEAKTS